MNPFRALRVFDGQGDARVVRLNLDDLSPGEVVVEVSHSGINFKDALAVSGRGKILRRFPLIAGIDAAGTVIKSSDPRFRQGQNVLVNGCGLGETEDGGFSEVLRVKADSVVPRPESLTARESMLLGTAGFTAALALYRMEQNGQTPATGPILITGASGGVGGIAVQIFAQQGYEVVALSGKEDAVDYLRNLGAAQVIHSLDQLSDRPLGKGTYGGAVDNVGGPSLAKILAHVQPWGNVAAIGLAESESLATTVMPFILRGVSLLGTSSSNAPMALRQEIWKKLAREWKPKHLEQTFNRAVGLEQIGSAAQDLLARRVRGRILVEMEGLHER